MFAILAVAFNLRLSVIGIGPVLAEIQADTGMSSAAASLLVAVPFACLGIFAFTGAALVRRFGASPLIAWSLLVLTVATALRAAMPTPVLLILATVPIGIAIAMVGVALPGVVKHHYSARGGTATGLYLASINVGGILVALTIVPMSELFGGWRWAFALLAIPAAMAIAVWHHAGAAADRKDHDAPTVSALRPPRTGVLLGVIFGLQGMVFAALVAWIAAIYVEAGWSEEQAALTAAVIPLVTVPAALIMPRISEGRDRRYWVLTVALIMALGTLLVGTTPTSVPILWLAILAIGSGSVFPLVMALPLDMRGTPAAVTDLAAWMVGLGYLMSGASPLLIGALRDATGSFTLPVAGVLTAAGVLCGLLALAVPKPAPLGA